VSLLTAQTMLSTFVLAIAAPMCAFASMEDFRIGIHTEDGRKGTNTGSIEFSPWAVQEAGGWTTFAGDSNFYGPDGLKIGIETQDLGKGQGFIADTDFRLALETCVGTSVAKCSSDTSDTQYTPWVSELTDAGDYSGWAKVATRFMDGWRVGIETRQSLGLQISNIKVGVQIEYSTAGSLQTTQSVGGEITSSWSDWAYNAAKNNGAIDEVRIFLQTVSAVATPDPTSMPTMEPTKDCDLLHIDEFLLDCSSEWEGARQMMEGVYSAAVTNSQNIASNAANIANGTAVIATNADNIASVASSVATNANNIASATAIVSTNADNIVTVTASAATNAEDISAVESTVATLKSKVAELESILDQLGVNSAANAAAPMHYAHAGAWNVDEPAGMADGAWNVLTVTGKDLGIAVLAVINMIMIAVMVIACKRSGGRTKYLPVAVGSDMEPINA